MLILGQFQLAKTFNFEQMPDSSAKAGNLMTECCSRNQIYLSNSVVSSLKEVTPGNKKLLGMGTTLTLVTPPRDAFVFALVAPYQPEVRSLGTPSCLWEISVPLHWLDSLFLTPPREFPNVSVVQWVARRSGWEQFLPFHTPYSTQYNYIIPMLVHSYAYSHTHIYVLIHIYTLSDSHTFPHILTCAIPTHTHTLKLSQLTHYTYIYYTLTFIQWHILTYTFTHFLIYTHTFSWTLTSLHSHTLKHSHPTSPYSMPSLPVPLQSSGICVPPRRA